MSSTDHDRSTVYQIEDWEVLAAARQVAAAGPPVIDCQLLLDALGLSERLDSLTTNERGAAGWLRRLINHYRRKERP